MAGSGVMRLRMARRSSRSLPIERNPTHPGRFTGAPKVQDQMSPSAPKKPDPFMKYDMAHMTMPKPIDRPCDGEGKVSSRSAHRSGRSERKK